MKLLIVSGHGAPKAFALDQRVPAVQELERRLAAAKVPYGGHEAARGNAPIRKFIEGQAQGLTWGDGRVDVISVEIA